MNSIVNESSMDQNLISFASGSKAASDKLAINIIFQRTIKKKIRNTFELTGIIYKSRAYKYLFRLNQRPEESFTSAVNCGHITRHSQNAICKL